MSELKYPPARRHGKTMRHVGRLVCAVASTCLLWTAMSAHAAPLPPLDATIIGDVLFNKGGRQGLNTFGSISVGGQGAAADLIVAGAPLPTITATAQAGPSGDTPSLFTRADAILTYAFEILGPADTVPVVIGVAGAARGDASAGASFAVTSLWQLFDSTTLATVLASDEIRSGQLSGSFTESFDHAIGLTLLTNHVYPIFLLADAAAAATDAGSRSVAGAFVDPRLSFGEGIDPLLFSFVFSAGIGNEFPAPPGSIPEPGTVGLLALSALTAGWTRRRRSRGTGAGTRARRVLAFFQGRLKRCDRPPSALGTTHRRRRRAVLSCSAAEGVYAAPSHALTAASESALS